MAKKPKLDFKGLMLAHMEKLACGVIAVCFVFLLWAAFSRDPVEAGIAPEDISLTVNQANANIKRTTWDDFNEKPQMRNFAQEAGWYEVPTKPYELKVAWNPEDFPKQDLRDDPKYYPLESLEAHFDQGPLVLLTADTVRGIFVRMMQAVPPVLEEELIAARAPLPKSTVAVHDPNKIVEGAGAGGPIPIELPGAKVEDSEVSEGRRWIMVKGLLPWQAQIDAYTDKFRNAAGFDQKNDLPLYFGYEVERADVTGGTAPVWEQHDKISLNSLQYVMVRWDKTKRSEIIAKANRDAIFTCPLPPRVLELWGSRDKHSTIPLESTSEPSRVAMPMARVIDPLGGLGETPPEEEEPETNSSSAQVAYKMLRYFDFKVQPGRAYQYRFRVALRDPNYVREGSGSEKGLIRVEIKLLEERVVKRINDKREALEKSGLSPEMAERYMQVMYSEWSDPSPVVKVPPDLYVLALHAEQPPEGKYNLEPAVSLMVTKYDSKLGIEVGGETKLERGNLAHFTANEVRVINIDHSTLETRKIEFNPNNLLIDIRGGQGIEGSSLTAPTEVLLLNLDKGGRLIIADEVEDASSVRAYRERQAKIKGLIPKSDGNSGGGVSGPRGTDIINQR